MKYILQFRTTLVAEQPSYIKMNYDSGRMELLLNPYFASVFSNKEKAKQEVTANTIYGKNDIIIVNQEKAFKQFDKWTRSELVTGSLTMIDKNVSKKYAYARL